MQQSLPSPQRPQQQQQQVAAAGGTSDLEGSDKLSRSSSHQLSPEGLAAAQEWLSWLLSISRGSSPREPSGAEGAGTVRDQARQGQASLGGASGAAQYSSGAVAVQRAQLPFPTLPQQQAAAAPQQLGDPRPEPAANSLQVRHFVHTHTWGPSVLAVRIQLHCFTCFAQLQIQDEAEV